MLNGNVCKKWMTSDVGLLILRLALGVIFIVHGYAKFAAMGETKAFFMMFHIPAFLAYVVAFFELLCGVLMVLGLFTWLAGIILAIIMVFAVFYVKSKFPISMAEIDLMAFASALALACTGPGRFALNPSKICRCGGNCFACKLSGVNSSSAKSGCPSCAHSCAGGVCNCTGTGCESCGCGMNK